MNPLLGPWRITSTELCSDAELERSDSARIEFAVGSTGRLRMGPLDAEIDFRARESRGGWLARFSWYGTLGGEDASGRGWVRMSEPRRLHGKIFVHGGDDPRFRAARL